MGAEAELTPLIEWQTVDVRQSAVGVELTVEIVQHDALHLLAHPLYLSLS